MVAEMAGGVLVGAITPPGGTRTHEEKSAPTENGDADSPRLSDDQENSAEYRHDRVVDGLRHGPVGALEDQLEDLHRLLTGQPHDLGNEGHCGPSSQNTLAWLGGRP